MKQQVVVIHGGNAFETYDEYLKNLSTIEISRDGLRSLGWKGNIEKDLGQGFEVLTPKMPNAQNARYLEWKIWFEKIILLLDKNIILVGHSLGGIFLVKYLSENNYPKKIKAALLVAAPYNTPTRHPLVDFNITSSLDNFTRQAGMIILYHSKDDLIVPFDNFEYYHKELPNSNLRIFEDRGHFNGEHFPEIVDDIKNLVQ